MENLALADVMNTHAVFPFYVAESEDNLEDFVLIVAIIN